MRDCPNDDDSFLHRIDNREREAPEEEPSRVVLAHRPTFGSFADRIDRTIKLFNEV